MSRKQHRYKFVWEKSYTVISLLWVNIHCKSKISKQGLQLWKGDDRIPILQLGRFRSKTKKQTKIKPRHEPRKMVLN